MKFLQKTFGKITLMIIVSIIMTGPIYAQEADGGTQFQEAMKDMRSSPCIKPDDEDKGYIITFIEEPLDIEDRKTDDFEYRRCVRNTLQYTIPAKDPKKNKPKTESLSFLSATCSQKGQDLLNNQNLRETYQVKFTCREIQAILSKGGTALIYGYIGMVYKWAASIVGVIAITVIILSGIQISASGGDPDAISKSKTRILQSIGGIVVLFLSGLILNAINPNFFTS